MTGIGFRKDFASEFLEGDKLKPSFIEVAPENWIGIGGYWNKLFRKALEKYPLYTHGLSLSIGSPDEIDIEFLKKVRTFLDENNAKVYSEHLSFSKCDNAHLYDLLPIPFTQEAVKHVSGKIKQVQDVLNRELVIEIVSYYTSVSPEMNEIDFINAVLKESDCGLLLDVNNIYVNSFNHNYDPIDFINKLPLDRVRYIHMAGHQKVAPDLIIDTHGEAIIDPVYELYSYAFRKLGREVPVLLERDFNIPELDELQAELSMLEELKNKELIQYASA
ncbi:MAG: DUF692 domain-containing protein [Bacteroidetes bacterium]|nr:MAG: DUF692 domain-containing protein [Bacteroidota bacterium]REK36248.1 MAG: DUF692 domain-containing protein [Bacteroidota bacterium]REK51090.1 MAG: DUF692 domain-containing protein [Bacteroidota bacterium]